MYKKLLSNAVEWAIRLNVFVKLTNYGLGKILGGQFYTPNNIPNEVAKIPLGDASGYDLAWTFFGHSKTYIICIGSAQLVGAILFLIPRTKLAGGFLLLPVLLNIILVDLMFGVAYGAVFSAVFYLVSVLWVLYRNQDTLKIVLKTILLRSKESMPIKYGKSVSIVLAFLGIIFLFEWFFIDFFGYDDRY